MKINPQMFRGYDLRGIVGTDLSPEIVEHIGKAFGTFLKRQGISEAVVGRDSRATSPEYSEAIIHGMSWAGVDTIDIGMTMVGTLYWSQYYLNRKGGVFITASHNPAEYNGMKFANDFSETLVSEGMNELRRMVQEDDVEKGERVGKIEKMDVLEAYIEDLQKRLSISKKFRVVVDASCTTAGTIMPEVLRSFGMDIVESNCNLDPTFPLGTPDPTETAVAERLKKKVLEKKADIGFTYDADGDRIGIVDENGGIIWNDVLVAIFAIDVLEKHPGAKIMYNLICSKVVEDTIKKFGGIPFMWRVGHSFLKKKNQEVKAAFIGELSGHFFFSADFYNHDDGCYTTLRLLDYLSRSGQTLAGTVASLPRYISSPEIKLGCADDKKAAFIEKVSKILKKDFPEAEVIDDERAGDGVRLNLPDSMFVVRYSQNGPYLTIKFEAQTQEKYNELKNYLKDILHKYEEVNWSEGVNVESLE
ncbi:MAG: phosphomannomutase/phosphoglucomutase [Candidatus Moranbacteria bacterium]|nr:phosphomannomutase/phosphoglucomutase [Candidatus Moranbacteria bacterium]